MNPNLAEQDLWKRETDLSFFTQAEYAEMMKVFVALSGGYVTVYALYHICVCDVYALIFH